MCFFPCISNIHTLPFFSCVFNKCDICVYKNKRRSFVHKCNKHEQRLLSCISKSSLQRSFFMLFEESSFSCFSTRARGLLSCFPKAHEQVNTCTQNWASAFLGALFLCFSIRACVLFSRSSHVFMCVSALYVHMHTSLLACLLDYFLFFFVFLIHYVFLILKKTWISLGKFKLLLSCVSILFWSFASQDKSLCIVFSSTKVGLEKYLWFFFRWVHPLFDVFTL